MLGFSSAAVLPSCAALAIATALYIDGPKDKLRAPQPSHLANHCNGEPCPDEIASQAPRLPMARAYFECAEKATRYVLNAAEALDCSTKYLELKLSFLPDVTLEDYKAMSATQRSETNRLSYQLYLKWKYLQVADQDAVTLAIQ